MCDLLQELIKCINCDVISPKIEERNKVLSVYIDTDNKKLSSFNDINIVLNKFPKRDNIKVHISNIIDEYVDVKNNGDLTQETKYTEFYNSIDDADELQVHIDIQKEIKDGVLSIYNINAFNEYLFSLNILEVMQTIQYDFNESERLVFELYDSELSLATETIIFRSYTNSISGTKDFQRLERVKECRKNSIVYWNNNKLPIPDDFKFVITSDNNPYKELFNKVESLLSLIYITDNTHIMNDKVICQILGQRMTEYDILLNELVYNEVIYDIYNWIYTEGNLVDKITLARNLLSLHCKYLKLNEIDNTTFMSIKANYSLYQKENVDKYIEVKNRMSEFLNSMINESKNIVLDVVSDLGKNIIAFFSFILTVFVSSIMSEKGLENIFTKDVTYFSYLILIGSLVFIVISNIISNFKIHKLKESYELIKENNDFFKDTLEYDELFDDEKINKPIRQIKNYKIIITLFWILMLVVVFVVIECLSSSAITIKIWNAITSFINAKCS